MSLYVLLMTLRVTYVMAANLWHYSPGKKNSYQASVGERFQDDRLTSEHQTLRNTFMASPSWPTGEQLIVSFALPILHTHTNITH